MASGDQTTAGHPHCPSDSLYLEEAPEPPSTHHVGGRVETAGRGAARAGRAGMGCGVAVGGKTRTFQDRASVGL